MAKELFLKFYIPEGQRHCVLNEANYKKIRPGYLLFSDKCLTPIKDEDAEALLRQNPRIISDKPMSASAIGKEKKRMARPAYHPDHINKRILDRDLNVDEATSMEIDRDAEKGPEFIIDDEVKETLVELAKMSDEEFKALKPAEIAGYGSILGVKIKTVGIKKTAMLKQLNDRAAEVKAETKGADEDYDADN
jgi:hypothetical protein